MMPIRRTENGWLAETPEGALKPFKTRAEARAWLKAPCDNQEPTWKPAGGIEAQKEREAEWDRVREWKAQQTHTAPKELSWETIPQMLPSQDIKAKNSQTGKVVTLTFKQAPNQYPGVGRLFLMGRKQRGVNTAILAFKEAAERIGADILEGVDRK